MSLDEACQVLALAMSRIEQYWVELLQGFGDVDSQPVLAPFIRRRERANEVEVEEPARCFLQLVSR